MMPKRTRLVTLVLLISIALAFLIAPIIFHRVLSDSGGRGDLFFGQGDEFDGLRIGSSDDRMSDVARKVLGIVDFTHLSGPELKTRIEEILRVKSSVQAELRGLEKSRKEMQEQIAALHRTIEDLQSEAAHGQQELERLRSTIEMANLQKEELIRKNTPEIRSPLKLLPSESDSSNLRPPENPQSCTMSQCFDYSRCSLTSQFPVFLYAMMDNQIAQDLIEDGYLTRNPDISCLYLVINTRRDKKFDEKSLKFWNGDGRNHLLINIHENSLSQLDKYRALIAGNSFSSSNFRRNFDLILPHISDRWENLESGFLGRSLPVRRQYLISFQGWKKNVSKLEQLVIHTLRAISDDETDDISLIETDCSRLERDAIDGEWDICGSKRDRSQVLSKSLFTLIFAPENAGSSPIFQLRLYEALQARSIPVILGSECLEKLLPYTEVIDWRQAVILLPMARITETHFFLRSFNDADLFLLQRKGSLIWSNYLANNKLVIKTLLQIVRDRLLIPPKEANDVPSVNIFSNSPGLVMQYMDELPPDSEPKEQLGPLELPRPSIRFRRNFSTCTTDSHRRWNTLFDPFVLPPYSPWDPLLPTDAKFLGSFDGFRPIADGAGGSGKEFSQALGGNVPAEQFTVVMLTYEREEVLMDAIARLHSLPFLNKVVIVWNTETPPSPDLRWPDIGVPVEVLKTEKNSLNNRFIPYDVIETEAVLSIDDDAHLRHDEIIFGFRVWRENRDNLVGFPGRFHAWDPEHNSWNYNSNYSCELSMVLTGAAFYHKYYSYAYTHLMPQAIRDKVDEYMNCEDIAMNFLVSHITRKPPVKVTSRWTFRCPGCPVVLSEDESHFQERHKCINFFKEIYGYMPLLYTQYRVDSVLFKTRIPQDKQKCFKYI